MFKRTQFTPAATSSDIMLCVAGPTVAIIFVRLKFEANILVFSVAYAGLIKKACN